MLGQDERIIVVKTPEEIRAEDLKRLKDFRWIDDTFARSGFKDKPDIAQFVLRIITGINDLVIDPSSFSTQYDAKRLAGSRSLMLDVHAGDTKGRKYDLEMEKSDASPERIETHVATMIVEHLHEGAKFSDLTETYVIFMCEHDEVGNERAVNSFSYRNDDLFLESEEIEKFITPHASLGGRTHIFMVNGDYKDDGSDIGKLIHDFKCIKADDIIFPNLAARMIELKESKEGVESMCQSMEKERIRTREEDKLITLMTLMRTQGWDAEKAMEAMDIPVSEKPLYARSIAHAISQRSLGASTAF